LILRVPGIRVACLEGGRGTLAWKADPGVDTAFLENNRGTPVGLEALLRETGVGEIVLG
jgi:sirohydrochlorin ferrochelatase